MIKKHLILHDIIIITMFYDFRDLEEIPLIPAKRGERERDIIVSVSVEIGSYTLNVVREGGVSFFATVLSFVIKCQASSSLKNPSLLCNMRKVRALRRPRNK